MAGYIGSKSSVTQVDGYSEAEADAEFVNDPNGAITVSGSNVGIGTSSPDTGLSVVTGSANGIELGHDSDASTDSARLFFSTSSGSNAIHSSSGSMRFFTGSTVGSSTGTERMRIDSSGNLLVGTTTEGTAGANQLTVAGSGNTGITIRAGASSGSAIYMSDATSGAGEYAGYISYSHGANAMTFASNSSERMRLDSSGRLLVGMTSSSSTASGFRVIPNDFMSFTTTSSDAGDRALLLNRQSSDGTLLEFKKANSAVGNIGSAASGGQIYISGSDTGLSFDSGSDLIFPCNGSGTERDNAVDLGYASGRFDDIYATNGTIQTSDFNEKQDIASLTATEMLVGARISALFKTFRWKDSVAENGDNARTHTGVIAQDVQAAFTAEGLDAGDYALFISSTWWETQTEVPAVEAVEAVAEVTDEDGNVTTEAVEAVEAVDAYTRTDNYDTEAEAPEGATSKTRMGIRYPELLSFVAAYNEQRFASIEARLTALEA